MFRVQYEIPPTRAIWTKDIYGLLEKSEVEAFLKRQHPTWKIHSIEFVDSASFGQTKRDQKAREKNKDEKGTGG